MNLHTQKPPIFLRYDLRIRCTSYRLGSVKAALPTSAREIPSCVATFLKIEPAPLRSALTKIPLAEQYRPRFTLLPLNSYPLGFSPYFGTRSLSRKLDLELYASSVSVKTIPTDSASSLTRFFSLEVGIATKF
jgi:hypothetical protein